MKKLVVLLVALFLVACVTLHGFTGEMRSMSSQARLEWEAHQRTLESKDRCASAALEAIEASERLASGLVASISKEDAARMRTFVVTACSNQAPESSHHGDMGHKAVSGLDGGVQDGGQDAARGR